jgi:hypothetical protein
MPTMNRSHVTAATLVILITAIGSACSSTATTSGATSPAASAGSAPDVGGGSVDGIPTAQSVRDHFAARKTFTSSSINGDSTSDHQNACTSDTGFGEDSFFDDYYTRSDGLSRAVASDFTVLRDTLPMSVEVDLDYNAQSGAATVTPATAIDPFQPDTLHSIIGAVTKVVLTTVT